MWKNHYGDDLIGTDNFFSCVTIWHKVKDFLNLNCQNKGSGHPQASNSDVDPPKNNRFYPLSFRGKKEISPDVVTGMFKVLSIHVYT